ncbi:MAG: hypothetical protein PWP08_569 [Methanofollis sp.]|nr:hypothetical protein [Methanofollis sp.]
MVLEETLLLRDIDDAQEIARTLKVAGMTVRIARSMELDRSVMVTGKVQDFRALFTEEIGRVEDPDLKGRYERTLAEVEKTADAVAAFMAEHPVGEALPPNTGEELVRPVMAALQEDDADNPLSDEITEKFLNWIRVLSLLQSNELIEKSDDGVVILQRHVDPDDLVMPLPFALFYEMESDLLETHGIRAVMTITSVPVCSVVFGADAIAGLDQEDVDDLAADLKIDVENYEEFRENFAIKKIVLEQILACLEERGTATAIEVFETLRSGPTVMAEGSLSLNIDIEYVREALADLQKARVIRKTGATFRIV